MPNRPIIGRFAPSPTGHLHLGSLTTAVASFCHVKSLSGKWLVRIEDVDFERCKSNYTTSILTDLENLGLWADDEIVYQSNRLAIYEAYLDKLQKLVYVCTCSRKELSAHFNANPPPFDPLSHTKDLNAPPLYPRLCLGKNTPYQLHSNTKIRLTLPDVWTAFYDDIQGLIWHNPAKTLGDVVIKRQNGMINYVLACAIDDGLQNISHVMRGLDILPMTVAQLAILHACDLPTPDQFYHLPLLHNTQGQKLSKQNLATPINTTTPDTAKTALLTALHLLKQPVFDDLQDGTVSEILAWAVAHWDNERLKGNTSLGVI